MIKATGWVLESSNNIFSFVEYISSALDEGFYCWVAGGGVQNVWTNISMFIVLSLVPQY